MVLYISLYIYLVKYSIGLFTNSDALAFLPPLHWPNLVIAILRKKENHLDCLAEGNGTKKSRYTKRTNTYLCYSFLETHAFVSSNIRRTSLLKKDNCISEVNSNCPLLLIFREQLGKLQPQYCFKIKLWDWNFFKRPQTTGEFFLLSSYWWQRPNWAVQIFWNNSNFQQSYLLSSSHIWLTLNFG